MEEIESEFPVVRTMIPVEIVGDLVGGRHAATGTILRPKFEKPSAAVVAESNLRDAVALRTDSGVEPDRRRIFTCVPALLELTESIPAQTKRIDQIGIENVNFADREIVRHRGCDAKPRTQLRAAAGASSAARELVFAFAVEISRRRANPIPISCDRFLEARYWGPGCRDCL